MKCDICERSCQVQENGTGACGMYRNEQGTMVERFPELYLVACPISVETMPMLHYYPAGKFLQVSTIGCNLDCPGCISTIIVKETDSLGQALHKLSVSEILSLAVKHECIGVAFLMNDPLASFPTFLRLAEAAKKQSLLVGCSSNSYFSETSLGQLIPHLDFIHVGFKGMSEQSYIRCGGKSVLPVLRNVRALFNSGVHVEVSCVHRIDNEHEMLELAQLLAQISPDIPFHIMRFIPLEDVGVVIEPTIRQSEDLCRSLQKHLNYVYLFNSPGTRYLNTLCPSCGTTVYMREFYGPMGAKLKLWQMELASFKGHTCPRCGREIKIIGEISQVSFKEGTFEGGYPFTRALEIIEAILFTIGFTEKSNIVKVWDRVLGSDGLKQLHMGIQKPEKFIEIIRYFGQLTNSEEKAGELAGYLEEKMAVIKRGLEHIRNRPSVYYAMGKPLFCLNAERMENQLVGFAGGISVNKLVQGNGRPGTEISAEDINALNPQFMFISAFLSSPPEDFYRDCIAIGINVDAVYHKNIHSHPIPASDFGSPRWILGLMYIANVLHPSVFHFDILAEAKEFYQRFYNMDFVIDDVNRSFSKPSIKWGTIAT